MKTWNLTKTEEKTVIAYFNRKQSDAPAESETEVVVNKAETEAEEEKQEEEVGKMVDILHVEETRTGQRSRRSSGYASACSSPSFLTKKAPANDPASTSGDPDEMEKWRTSLYEVTLRWMFDTQPHDWVIPLHKIPLLHQYSIDWIKAINRFWHRIDS